MPTPVAPRGSLKGKGKALPKQQDDQEIVQKKRWFDVYDAAIELGADEASARYNADIALSEFMEK